MQDRPDAAQLLEAIATTLEGRVLPHAGAAGHDVRVAANLCRILQRELLLDGDADARARETLGPLVGHDGPTIDLWQELARQLAAADPADDGVDARCYDAVLAVVRDKVAVAKPGYDGGSDR